MRSFVLLVALHIFTFQLNAWSADFTVEKVPIESAWVSVLSNSKIKLEVSGHLPNSCHSAPYVRIVKSRKFEIAYVDILARVGGEFCAEIAQSFSRTIFLGGMNQQIRSVRIQSDSVWEIQLSLQ